MKITKLLGINALALGLLAFAGSASAQQSVGLVLSAFGGAPSATETAGYGAYAQLNWNSTAPMSGGSTGQIYSGSGLKDSTGATSSVGYSVAINGGVPNGTDPFTYQNGDGQSGSTNVDDFWLYGGAAYAGASSPVTLTLSGLTVGDTYTVLSYVNCPTWGNVTSGAITVGSTTYYFSDVASAGPSGYVPITSQDSSSPTFGDVAVFTNVTPDSGGNVTLTVSNAAGGYPASPYASLSAVQLVNTGSIPEPATIWSVCLGLLGLVGYRARRRA